MASSDAANWTREGVIGGPLTLSDIARDEVHLIRHVLESPGGEIVDTDH
jgi:hypothetical protein